MASTILTAKRSQLFSDLLHGEDATSFDGDRDDGRRAGHRLERELAAEAQGAVAHEGNGHNRSEKRKIIFF